MTSAEYRDHPTVLAVAGFDPSGDAGIIADVKTIASFGCRPVAAITSLTFQNSQAVFGATHENAESLRAQILPIVEENRIAAVKVGMIPTAELVIEVARLIREGNLPAPVVDPVLRSSSGFQFIEEDAIEVLLAELFPLARLVTPNIPEAKALAGVGVKDQAGMRAAAQKLREMGARSVLIKGGHLKQESGVTNEGLEVKYEAVDVLDDDGQVMVFRGEWIDAPTVRGTGCMLSSGIAACLAQGIKLEEAVRLAKEFVADEIRYSQT